MAFKKSLGIGRFESSPADDRSLLNFERGLMLDLITGFTVPSANHYAVRPYILTILFSFLIFFKRVSKCNIHFVVDVIFTLSFTDFRLNPAVALLRHDKKEIALPKF